jgi:hypothetical protein
VFHALASHRYELRRIFFLRRPSTRAASPAVSKVPEGAPRLLMRQAQPDEVLLSLSDEPPAPGLDRRGRDRGHREDRTIPAASSDASPRFPGSAWRRNPRSPPPAGGDRRRQAPTCRAKSSLEASSEHRCFRQSAHSSPRLRTLSQQIRALAASNAGAACQQRRHSELRVPTLGRPRLVRPRLDRSPCAGRRRHWTVQVSAMRVHLLAGAGAGAGSS